MAVVFKWSTSRLVAVVLALALAAGPVVAAPSKVMVALVAAAQKEFDAGNFARAGELFLDVWKQDKTQIVAIYNAARAYQLAGNLDKGEELFREMVALPGLDPAVKVKCDNQLQAIGEKRGEQKAEAAATAEKAGNFTLAAQLWGDALGMQPDKMAWLLRQGRAQHLAGNKQAALAIYDRYLALPPEKAPGQSDAARWRAEIAPATFEDAPVPKDVPAAAVVATVQAPSKWPAYAVLGAGVAAMAGGGILLAVANADDAALQLKFKKVDAAGHIVGMTPAEAATASGKVESQYLQGWIAAGVGAAATGVGVWMLLRKPEAKAVVVPTRDGAMLAVRF